MKIKWEIKDLITIVDSTLETGDKNIQFYFTLKKANWTEKELKTFKRLLTRIIEKGNKMELDNAKKFVKLFTSGEGRFVEMGKSIVNNN